MEPDLTPHTPTCFEGRNELHMVDQLTVSTRTRFAMVPEWVLRMCGPRRALKHTDLAVYTALLSYAWGGGAAWPSHATIAETTGLAVRSVPGSIRRLIAAGVVTRESRWTDGSGTASGERPDGTTWRQTSNLYVIHIDPPQPVDNHVDSGVDNPVDDGVENTAEPVDNREGGTFPNVGGGTSHSAGGGTFPSAGNKRRKEQKHRKKKTLVRASTQHAPKPGFEELWEIYPKTGDITRCRDAWGTLDAEPEKVIASARAWIAHWDATETEFQYIPALHRWLTGHNWETTPPAPWKPFIEHGHRP